MELGSLLFPAGAAESPSLVSLVLPVLFAVAARIARGRGWPLSFRRALLFFLVASLVPLTGFLPAEARLPAHPYLRIFWTVLVWAAVFECLQGLVFDLLLGSWLRRPAMPRILRDTLTLLLAVAVFLLALRGVLGVDLTSLIATSAMISVILGLALQDTLGSFFAGLALQMEMPFRIGDWIQLEGHLGEVTQVTWRSMRLVTLDGDEITLPNSLLTRTTIANYSRPTPSHREAVAVGTHYRHPPYRVIAILEAAAAEVPGVLAEPPPHALLWEYGDSSINYRLRFWVNDFHRLVVIAGEVRARIWYHFHREGIEIPFPIRVLDRPRPDRRQVPEPERIAKVLRGVELFGPLGEEEIGQLARQLRAAYFGRGEAVIRQGEGGDSMFVLVRGTVEVRVRRGGREGVVGTLSAGSVFGEMSLLTGEPRSATVVALVDSEVIPVTKAAFLNVVRARPELADAVAGIVAGRRGHLEETIQATEQAAARRPGSNDLIERMRAFFGL